MKRRVQEDEFFEGVGVLFFQSQHQTPKPKRSKLTNSHFSTLSHSHFRPLDHLICLWDEPLQTISELSRNFKFFAPLVKHCETTEKHTDESTNRLRILQEREQTQIELSWCFRDLNLPKPLDLKESLLRLKTHLLSEISRILQKPISNLQEIQQRILFHKVPPPCIAVFYVYSQQYLIKFTTLNQASFVSLDAYLHLSVWVENTISNLKTRYPFHKHTFPKILIFTSQTKALVSTNYESVGQLKSQIYEDETNSIKLY